MPLKFGAQSKCLVLPTLVPALPCPFLKGVLGAGSATLPVIKEKLP